LIVKAKAEPPVSNKEINRQKFHRMRPNLYILRCAKGMSQKECEEACGLKSKRWEQLEARIGYPTLDEMINISEFFGIPIDHILNKSYKIIFE
jgi:transcriptional regulator with XRE-family HTH domain